MSIDDYFAVTKAVARPNENIGIGFEGRLVVTPDGKMEKAYFLNPTKKPEKFLCFILARLPEWEDRQKFRAFHGLPQFWMGMVIPLDWLTSPSILPEKLGEYIEWRDKNGKA